MRPLRVAVVGLGIGRRHIRSFQALPDTVVTAVCGHRPGAVARAVAELAIPDGCTDYDALLARQDVDAVVLCTPDRLHAAQCLAALEAGKHVLCEKPLATSAADAVRVVHKARETDLCLMVGHNYRFEAPFVYLKNRLDQGAIGEPFYGESRYVQDLYSMANQSADYWRLADPQDFVLGGAIHNVDLLRWALGEVKEVHAYATGRMPFYPLPDSYCINLRFAGDRIGRVLLLLGARLRAQFSVDLQVYGTEGGLTADMQRHEVTENLAQGEPGEPGTLRLSDTNSFALEAAEFVAAVRQGRAPAVTVADGAQAVAICEAAVRSAREGRAIAVEHLDV
ncbi:MAG: Gfo/Idh/MocA family protein [Anaerolineae bacterium]